MVNYGRKLRIGADIRRKGKVKKITKFVERSKGSIKKSTGGNEVTSRQEEKRS